MRDKIEGKRGKGEDTASLHVRGGWVRSNRTEDLDWGWKRGSRARVESLIMGRALGKYLLSRLRRGRGLGEGQARAGHLCGNVKDYDSVTLSLTLGLVEPYILASQFSSCASCQCV